MKFQIAMVSGLIITNDSILIMDLQNVLVLDSLSVAEELTNWNLQECS